MRSEYGVACGAATHRHKYLLNASVDVSGRIPGIEELTGERWGAGRHFSAAAANFHKGKPNIHPENPARYRADSFRFLNFFFLPCVKDTSVVCWTFISILALASPGDGRDESLTQNIWATPKSRHGGQHAHFK